MKLRKHYSINQEKQNNVGNKTLVPPPETNCLFVAKEIVFKLWFDSLFPPFSRGMMKWLASQRFSAWQEMEAGSEQWTQWSLDSYCADVNQAGLPCWNKHYRLIFNTRTSHVSCLSGTIDFLHGISVSKVIWLRARRPEFDSVQGH